MSEPVPEEIRRTINDAHQILVISHIRPDGDAVGGLLGLGLSLQAAGKQVQMVLADGVPLSYRHLSGSQLITRRPKSEYDVVIILDCSDLMRAGGILGDRIPDINIDHHATNLKFARLNIVRPEAVATSEILATILPELGLPITQDVASALLTGVVSDTIGFRTTNVTPTTLRLAAGLMEQGANLSDLYNQALVKRSFEAALFWGVGLDENRLQRDGRILWTTLMVTDRERINYPGNDDADLINHLSTIDGCDISIIFVEQKNGKVKVSWRGVPGVDVSKVALKFGGGGHKAAAGAEVSGDLRSVQSQVLHATLDELNKTNGNTKKMPLT